MKRTTLILNERTFAEVRRLAAEEGCTMSQVVDEMLRSGVAERRKARRRGRTRIRLPSFKTGLPRVDIADRNALHDFLDANS